MGEAYSGNGQLRSDLVRPYALMTRRVMCGGPESCCSKRFGASGEKVVGECKLVIGKLHNVIAGTRSMRAGRGHGGRRWQREYSAKTAQNTEGSRKYRKMQCREQGRCRSPARLPRFRHCGHTIHVEPLARFGRRRDYARQHDETRITGAPTPRHPTRPTRLSQRFHPFRCRAIQPPSWESSCGSRYTAGSPTRNCLHT
jgi:hypothetical protein